ncbi:hypothetical protein BgiBS90_004394, partial [Biomphalaria glabrata]
MEVHFGAPLRVSSGPFSPISRRILQSDPFSSISFRHCRVPLHLGRTMELWR